MKRTKMLTFALSLPDVGKERECTGMAKRLRMTKTANRKKLLRAMMMRMTSGFEHQ